MSWVQPNKFLETTQNDLGHLYNIHNSKEVADKRKIEKER